MQANAFRWPDVSEDNPIQHLRRRMIKGEQMLVAKVSLEKGCHVDVHQHVSEQMAIVVSGHVRWTIGAEGSAGRTEVDMRGGEVMHLPANVPHGVDALEDTEIIDVLSPAGPMGVDHQRGH
jgi:quercetin dioxygenase-like cupin family protein